MQFAREIRKVIKYLFSLFSFNSLYALDFRVVICILIEQFRASLSKLMKSF